MKAPNRDTIQVNGPVVRSDRRLARPNGSGHGCGVALPGALDGGTESPGVHRQATEQRPGAELRRLAIEARHLRSLGNEEQLALGLGIREWDGAPMRPDRTGGHWPYAPLQRGEPAERLMEQEQRGADELLGKARLGPSFRAHGANL